MSKKVNVTLPSPNQLQLQVKLFGKWEKVTALTDKLGPSIQKGYDYSTRIFANRLLKIIQNSIRTGTPPKGSGIRWEEMSYFTKQRYGEHPLYYLTGLYYRAVGIHKYKSRTIISLPISQKRSSQGGITLNELAKILEFGTGGKGGGKNSGNIPARPLWAPSFKSVGGREGLRKEIIKGIRSQLLKDFGIKANQVKW